RARGSHVLQLWNLLTISVLRKRRTRMSQHLRDTYGRHSGCQRDCGRRVPQIVQSDSWETSQLKYHFEMLGEIIGMDWVSRRRFEDQVTALWTQTVGARFRLQNFSPKYSLGRIPVVSATAS